MCCFSRHLQPSRYGIAALPLFYDAVAVVSWSYLPAVRLGFVASLYLTDHSPEKIAFGSVDCVRRLLQPDLSVGMCWPFVAPGNFTVLLREPIIVESVSIDHPALSSDTAPKHFSVWVRVYSPSKSNIFVSSRYHCDSDGTASARLTRSFSDVTAMQAATVACVLALLS